MTNDKRWPPEFWAWAQEHGIPERQPRGSLQNKERQQRIAQLYSQWVQEHKT